MNWETIIVALIAASFPLIGTIFTNRQQTKMIEYRLKEVEKKVDRHNNFDRRLVAVETKLGMKAQEEKTA